MVHKRSTFLSEYVISLYKANTTMKSVIIFNFTEFYPSKTCVRGGFENAGRERSPDSIQTQPVPISCPPCLALPCLSLGGVWGEAKSA